MFVQVISSKLLNTLSPNLAWWCIIMRLTHLVSHNRLVCYCCNTNFHLLLSSSISFTSTKACIVRLNNIFYLHFHSHTILSYTHSLMHLFPQKLLILYTTFPALLKLNTTSTPQQAWNKVWSFNLALLLNYSTPNREG